MMDCTRRLSWLALLFLLLAAPGLYASNGDQVHVGQTITVGEGENAGNLVCIACSIHMQGTSGDMVAIGGGITLEGEGKGAVVTIGGGVHLGENAAVDGDVVIIGGHLWRHPNAVVKGSVTAQSGALILLGLVLGPLIPVILIVALIMWLVSRKRRPTPARA